MSANPQRRRFSELDVPEQIVLTMALCWLIPLTAIIAWMVFQ